jgi:UDP-N-acetyl-D-mannosaminuronic acid transferase (WecB/TagA/CpsF family)
MLAGVHPLASLLMHKEWLYMLFMQREAWVKRINLPLSLL